MDRQVHEGQGRGPELSGGGREGPCTPAPAAGVWLVRPKVVRGGPAPHPPLKSCPRLVSCVCLHGHSQRRRPDWSPVHSDELCGESSCGGTLLCGRHFPLDWSQPLPLQVGRCRQEMLDCGTGVQTPRGDPILFMPGSPGVRTLGGLWRRLWEWGRGGARTLLRGLSGRCSRWSQAVPEGPVWDGGCGRDPLCPVRQALPVRVPSLWSRGAKGFRKHNRSPQSRPPPSGHFQNAPPVCVLRNCTEQSFKVPVQGRPRCPQPAGCSVNSRQ